MILKEILLLYVQKSLNTKDVFVGKQVIVTQNQYLYDLSNGDIGIIVSLDNVQYMMIKREQEVNGTETQTDIIRHKGKYVFYPLYLLPLNAIEAAYAITIHKSQGSEYNNVLVLLPNSENSPLLNRQLLYTAVTRTKKSTYIVSDKDKIEKAIQNLDRRNTQLFL